MKPSQSVLLIAVILILGACVSENRNHTLNFSPAPGHIYKYDIIEETHTLATEQGERNNRVNNLSVTFEYELPAEGSSDLELTCDAFSIHQENGTWGQLNMDAGTAGEFADPGLRMFSAYSGAKMTGKLDANGLLETVSGLKGVYDQMTAIGRQDGDNNDGLAYTWQRGYNEGYFTGLLRKGWKLGDNQSINIGDTWVGTDSLNADPSIQVPTTFTLLRERDGVLYVRSDADIDIANLQVPRSVHPGRIALKGRQRGEWQLDAQTGMVLEGRTKLTASGVLKAGEGSIPLHIDSNCTVKKA